MRWLDGLTDSANSGKQRRMGKPGVLGSPRVGHHLASKQQQQSHFWLPLEWRLLSSWVEARNAANILQFIEQHPTAMNYLA